MRDELVAGLRNALERGQSLEQAAQSLFNAGYNPQEVKAAVQMLSSGVSNMVYSQNQKRDNLPIQKNLEVPQNLEKKNSGLELKGNVKKENSGRLGLIILIIGLIVIFLGALGYVLYYYFSH